LEGLVKIMKNPFQGSGKLWVFTEFYKSDEYHVCEIYKYIPLHTNLSALEVILWECSKQLHVFFQTHHVNKLTISAAFLFNFTKHWCSFLSTSKILMI
jgi:hypothetical protein